jgi:hypothetical protein
LRQRLSFLEAGDLHCLLFRLIGDDLSVRCEDRHKTSAGTRSTQALGGSRTETNRRRALLLVEGEVVYGEGHAIVTFGASPFGQTIKGQSGKHIPLATLETQPGKV